MSEDLSVRMRINLGYRGTDFHGWAIQPGLRTVQGEVEAALERLAQVPVSTIVAGRTDTGVHARRQVIHVDLPPDVVRRMPGPLDNGPGEGLTHRLRGILNYQGAEDVVVQSAQVAPVGFDARFSAEWRRYTYRISDKTSFIDPIHAPIVTFSKRVLDVRAMNAAAAELLGLHDFLPYCKPRPGATTVRTLQRLNLARDDDHVILATIKADAFCHHMVRALMGALMKVGEGNADITWPARVLASGNRDDEVYVAPANALVLEEVSYPGDAELAARAEQTRARRRAEMLSETSAMTPFPG